MKPEDMDRAVWDWTCARLEELKNIASEARKASKTATSLKDKVRLLAIEKEAISGQRYVAAIFGKVAT